MKFSSLATFLTAATSSALLIGNAAAGVEEHFGVGFSTKYMSNPPSHDVVVDKILPDLKDKLGISKFRIYNAITDAEYVADLISGNKDTKFIVDVGFIWWNESDQITIDQLTQEDVNRYLTHYIDTVGKTVKAKNGEDYEWLDNVSTIGYVNEPYIEYLHWWSDLWETLTDAAHGLNKLNRMVQKFFNTYMDGKYKTKITIAPIFIGDPLANFTEIMLEESIKLQADAGAPIDIYSNAYACHPILFDSYTLHQVPFDNLASCIGLPGVPQTMSASPTAAFEVSSMVEAKVMNWKTVVEQIDIPIDPSEVGIVITETGWPTDGFDFGNDYLSGAFYSSLLRLMNDPSNIMHNVDVYFFEALDEDLKPGHPVEPHWGLMYGDGTIKEGIMENWLSLNVTEPEGATSDVLAASQGSDGNGPMELIDGELVPSN